MLMLTNFILLIALIFGIMELNSMMDMKICDYDSAFGGASCSVAILSKEFQLDWILPPLV